MCISWLAHEKNLEKTYTPRKASKETGSDMLKEQRKSLVSEASVSRCKELTAYICIYRDFPK